MRPLIFLCVILILPNITLAESLLHLELTIYPNDTVSLDQLTLSDGIPTRFLTPGNYLVNISGKDKEILYSRNFSVNFFILSDPPTPINSSEVILKVPYDQKMKLLEIYKDGDLLLHSEINVCNEDSICQKKYENYLSCPKDCPLDKTDGYCINDADGVCDPDCFTGIDLDCPESIVANSSLDNIEEKPRDLKDSMQTGDNYSVSTTETSEDKTSQSDQSLIIILIGALVSAVLIYVWRKLKFVRNSDA